MSEYRHPDETGGGMFLFLMIVGILYCWFVLHETVGEFKQCDAEKYPYQSFCIKKDQP